MKERPILFQGAMVRALLAGTKTQTRRAVKGEALNWLGEGLFTPEFVAHRENGMCPYGFAGDLLWVREAWGYFDPDGSGQTFDDGGPLGQYRDEMMQEGHPLRDYWRRRIAYRATFAEQKYGMGPVGPSKWRPSIHMPRWASRITLEVTAVRVERLQAISEADVIAEGCPGEILYGTGWYRALWESINGPGSWDANPWVWVVEFKKAIA